MTIEASLDRIAAALEALTRMAASTPKAEAVSEPQAAEPVPEKRGRGRPTKEEAEAKRLAEEAAAREAAEKKEDDFLADEPAPEIPLTLDDVRKALVEYGKRAASQEKARAILKQYGGVDTLRALTPDKFRAVVDAASK